jgi:molybdopterin-binding protein
MPEDPFVRIGLDCGLPLKALLTRQSCAELGLEVCRMLTALIKAPQIHII